MQKTSIFLSLSATQGIIWLLLGISKFFKSLDGKRDLI